ncbi:sortase domain-containing protein [Butyrivibrio sp. INlla14]|uniref:sortase domain-containing protein n=1 Tax=Butyrivibrio sp. INlla14 TaxID=1520808 RepID=UPI0008760C89|nr:sortase [Butyrivibrio sp. INlla14]SCX98060.1 sortase, SrtB family [Butyrivibrio sp. INlla14]
MKKSLLSIFLAGVLFFSNIGMTSFAVEREQDASGVDVSSQEDGEKENEKALDISEEEEISYYKITDFAALPENISQQKVRIGASLDDIEFPDTLEVKVEPDLDREDRIMRKLAQERERIRKEKELEEAEAASSASSDEADEAASEGSSFDEDEEEIIIFDDGEQIDDASELSQEDERKEESTEKETGNDAPATDSTIAPSEPVSSTEESALPVETGEGITEEQDDEKEPGSEDENIGNEGDGAENSSDQGNSMEIPGAENTAENGLIGRILDAFRSVRVYAADDSKENKEESKDDLDISENEKTEQTSEPSIERISGIEWVLEAEYNDGVDFFSPDQDGQIYLFTPVLLIPDNYYIEDELPIITVIVSDEYFPFDEAVEVDGVTIRVRADKGVFPEGATVSGRKLATEDQEKVQAAFDEQVEVDTESIVKEYTFDITVLDRDGNEVEPDTDKGRVFVSFETEEVADESLSAEVYHFVESVDENAEAEAKENEAGDIEIGAEVELDVGESELGGERDDVIFDDDVILFVEKLEPEVVEVDESQAIEVETFGFSTYKVLFKFTNSINAEIEYSPVSLEQLFDSQYSNSGQVTAVKIDSSYDTYLYADILNYSTNGGQHIANTSADGLYTTGAFTEGSYEYFLVVRRPFGQALSNGIEIKVSYTTSTTPSVTTVYPVTVKDASNIEASMDNYNYPTATELGAKTFSLEMPMASINGGAIYQWEKKGTAADSKWEDIPFANTYKFQHTDASTFGYEGYWLRCTVNGVPSKEIQIVTPGGDSRTWTNPYGSNNQCYVSNGKLAYTICTTSGTVASPSKKIFDVVGEFQDGSTKKMMSTTNDGEGWKIFSNKSTDTLANVGWSGDSYNMDYMYFSFTEDNKLHVTAKTNLTDDSSTSYDNFAIGAKSKIGGASSNLAIAKADTNKFLTSMAVIGGTKEAAQKEVNNGTDGIGSFAISASSGAISKYYYVGADSAIKPYRDSTGNNPSTEYSDNIIGVAVGWTGLTGKVEFDIAVGGVSETNALVPVSKTGDSKSYSLNSNVKTLKLSSDAPLDSYAKSDQAGGINDTVKIELRFNSGSSNGKTAISNILPTYAKTSTTTTTSNASGTNSNSNSSTTPYSADYFDVNVKNYKNGSTSGITVDEINDKVVIEVNYNFENKENIKVYRDHNGASELKQDDSGAEGTCRIDKENGKIYIYTKKFSTYAVAYKPEVYYTVTFKDGTNTNSVKVKAGEKVARPTDPVKEGYTFVGWFKSTTLASSSTSSSSSSSKLSASDAFDFETPITANIVLNAGWTSTKDTKEKTGEDGDVNGARAPGTNDSLPIVWLWVLVLIAGVSSFGYAFYERFKAKGGESKAGARMSKLKRMILLIGIVVSTVVKFLIKKIKQRKYECMLAASAILILISVVTLVSTYFEYRRSEEIYIDVNDEYVDENSENADEMANAEDGTSSATNAEDIWWKDASVDVAGLSAEYPDVVGWIYFENEDISYPIMYSGDNSKYLGTAYTGQKARAGAIFIDGESTPDFSDPHSLIYGHNMRDLSMFGRLKFYKTDASYYDEHQYFQVFTKDGVYRYQIFAYEEVPDSHDVFWVYGQEPEGMDTMLKEIEQGSYRKTGVNPTEGDHIITLATCTSKEDRRLIVSAVRTDEHNF